MATALTVYMQEVNASSTISTANALIENGTTTTSNTNKNTATNSGTTGWIEVYSQGNASAVSGAGSEPAPSGHGWCDDGTTFSGMQFITGTWTTTVKLSLSSGSATADLHCRAYQRSSGGTYTLIAEMTATSQSLTTTATAFTCTASGVAVSNTFASTDKLYIDLIVNITASSSGTTLKLQESSSGTQGYTSAQVVTPGYVTSNAMGGATPNALTAYITAANSSRLGSAELLVNVSGGSATSGSNTIGTQTGWGELGLGGPQATFGGTDIGSPSGLGAYLDSRILEGNDIVPGNYSGTLNLSISESSKAVNGVLVLRFYKYNTNTTTYTAIGSITLTGQSINSTSAIAFNFPATAMPVMSFEVNSSLYIDAWLDITSNTMDASGALNIFFSSSTTQGYSGAEVVTPGYLTTATEDILAVTDIGGLQAWNVDSLTSTDTVLATDSTVIADALTAADSVLVVDVDQPSDALFASDIGNLQAWPIDALTISDVTLSTDTTVIADVLNATDLALYVASDLPLEALTVSDVTNVTDAAGLSEANAVSDIGGLQVWGIDALTAADALLETDTGSFTDSQSASDSLAQSDGYATSDNLATSDTTLSTDSAGVIDANTVNDIGAMQSWGIDALSASDALLEANAYLVSEAQSVVDALLGIDSSLYSDLLPLTDSGSMAETPVGPTNTEYDFTDVLSSTDLFASSGTLLAEDDNVSSDSLAMTAQYQAGDALQVGDSSTQSGIYQPGDDLTASDALAQSDGYQTMDAQSITDSFAQSDVYQASEVQSVVDALSGIDGSLYIELLSISDELGQSGPNTTPYEFIDALNVSDALLSTDAITLLDQAAISDSSVSSFGLVGNDALQVSDQNSVVIVVIPVEALTATDQLVASRDILNWIDSLSISDLFAYASSFPLEQTSAIVVAIGRNGSAVALGRSGNATPAQGR